MVSDWDLSAAFLSASDPGEGSGDEDAWELIKSTEFIPPSPSPKKFGVQGKDHAAPNQENGKDNPSAQPGYYPINFNSKINTVGIFNTMERWVQKAKTFVEDLSVVTTRPPLSDVEFRHYLDVSGILSRPKELRYACYHGGIEMSLRKVVWKHLLNVYPDGLTGNGRMDYIRNKARDYYELRDIWKNAMQNGLVNEEVMCVSNMVRKDVLRTDRHLKYFAGHDDNQNIANLFNILTTYALNHPSVGYCQGMSDLASPLLVVMGDEAQAYICFCSVMERIKPNFNTDGLAMSLKFTHLAEALAYYDTTFWSYLKSIGADDLLFCYRWLLLEMKREFAFEDALRMMEVLWASLPYKPQDVPLYEVKFLGISSHSVPIPVPSLTTSYSKVCALRRSSTALNSLDIRQRRYASRKQRASPNLSLDESSLTSLSSANTSSVESSHRKPFYSLDETFEILKTRDLTGTSPFEILSIRETPASQMQPRLIKNLKEFYQFSSSKARTDNLLREDSNASVESSESSTVSNAGKSHSNSVDSEVFMNLQPSSDDDLDNSALRLSTTPKIHNFVFPKSIRDGNHPPNPHTSDSRENCTNPFLVGNATTLQNANSAAILERTRGLETGRQAAVDTSLSSKDRLNDNMSENADSSSGHATGSIKSDIVPPDKDNLMSNTCKQGSGLAPVGEFCNDSENDSGNCCSESYDLDEASLEEPEFQDKCRPPNKLPPPNEFGGGNPMLMFLCLTLLLQHRDHIMRNQLDYNETAMYFDKLVRKHNVARVLAHARQMYANYLKQSVPRV